MPNQVAEIRSLFQRYVANMASQEELTTLFHFLNDPAHEAVSEALFLEMIYPVKDFTTKTELQADLALAWENITQADPALQIPWQQPPAPAAPVSVVDNGEAAAAKSVHRIPVLRRHWCWYAAAVVIVMGSAVVWYGRYGNLQPPEKGGVAVVSGTILPGTNRATLTVGNQPPIQLANDKNGIVAGASITYNDGEQIADAAEVLQLTTPRGGQYQVVLPDGSRVWLNAASSIRFPASFAPDKREVEVSGEVYMDVVKNPSAPFRVITARAAIQVLGTSFNIKAYPDEESQHTTLVTGSLKVSAADHNVVIQPGQQAIAGVHTITVQTADIEQTVGWKEGVFRFNRTPLPEAMRQLSRWYDVEVVYAGAVPNVQLGGEMKRDLNLAQVLEGLSGMGVECRIAGKRLIVL